MWIRCRVEGVGFCLDFDFETKTATQVCYAMMRKCAKPKLNLTKSN